MIKTFGRVLLMVGILSGAGVAVAANTDLPQILKDLQKDGALVEFIGHAYGLDGWRLVNKQDVVTYAYTTSEGGVVLGRLMDPKGGDETNRQLKALQKKQNGGQASIPGAVQSKTAQTKAERLYALVENAGWVRVGSEDAPYIYMFVNTTCIHCQGFWKDLQGAIKGGSLQVRLLPFGKIEVNRMTGAALLAAVDPAVAWSAFIEGDEKALSVDKATKDMLALVDGNTDLFMGWKMKGPPFTLYRKPTSGVVTGVVGRPENIMMVLADLLKQ